LLLVLIKMHRTWNGEKAHLHGSRESWHDRVVAILLAAGDDQNGVDVDGTPALMVASGQRTWPSDGNVYCCWSQCECCNGGRSNSHLKDIDPQTSTCGGMITCLISMQQMMKENTPLHLAIISEHFQVVELLLANRSAYQNSQCNKTKWITGDFIFSSNEHVVKMLVVAGVELNQVVDGMKTREDRW
jgi:ankyrin repeat protein